MITHRQGAIISAYTGILLGEFSHTREYIEELQAKDPAVSQFDGDSVERASKQDFINLKVVDDDSREPGITQTEAAIVTGFTGICLGDFGFFQNWAERLLDRQIWSHQFGSLHLWNEIKEACQHKFVSLKTVNEVPKDKNYVQDIRDRLNEIFGGMNEELLNLYTLLVLVKGKDVNLKDVHDAWAVWKNNHRPDHRSLIPFENLSEAVQLLDLKYVNAIAKVSE